MAIPDNETDEMRLCTECIGNEKFSSYIESEGKKGECSFSDSHGRKNHTLDIETFCQFVDKYFRENYSIGTEYVYATEDSDNPSYNTYGDTLDNIFMNDLLCDDDVTSAIISNLIENDDYDPRDGEDSFYDGARNYESIKDVEERVRIDFEDYWYENRVNFQWQDFCKNVIYRSRFFNIKEQLDDLFGDTESYSLDDRRAVYTIKKGEPIYRARKITIDIDSNTIKNNPIKEIGAPPPEKTIAGRMNVHHIPAFYASFSPEVALQELQPYISEEVAVGKFILKRDIKVFDFTIFDRIFDEKYTKKGMEKKYDNTRYKVITLMQEEISKPISADNKSREYIPTQILTEYIQEHFDVDAIIYFSSLFSNLSDTEKNKDSRNIVLLNRRFNNGDFAGSLLIEKDSVSIKTVKKIKYEFENKIDMNDLF